VRVLGERNYTSCGRPDEPGHHTLLQVTLDDAATADELFAS